MLQSKQHISDLASMLVHLGISGVVISPGSRNAPLIRAFAKQKAKLYSIVDERSAAYFALGLTLKTKTPTVLLCTSGTAVLNYAPAIAEAFYQQVPLLVLTADRPPEAICQNENQTIYQEAIYGKNCKNAFNMICEPASFDDWKKALDTVYLAYHLCITGDKGPVQINIPLREPLYNALPDITDYSNLNLKEIENQEHEKLDKEYFEGNPAVLIVVGQYEKDDRLQEIINDLLKIKIVVYAESISNLKGEGILTNGDFITDSLPKPDIVVFTGGQVVSKRMNSWLRSLKNTLFIQFAFSARMHQPFGQDCKLVKAELYLSVDILKELEPQTSFHNSWLDAFKTWKQKRNQHITKVDYSDITAARKLNENLPENSVLFLGNSSVIRNMQLFDISVKEVFANRGTSGIDGCLSTAVGIANVTTKNVFVVLGDISFLYDSNGLWNNHLPGNLKIIVFNNGGGEIFKLINEPSEIKDILPYQETQQNIDIAKLCDVYGVEYVEVKEETNFTAVFNKFIKIDKTPALLEINTRLAKNAHIFKSFIKKIK